MELNASREVASWEATEEFPNTLRNPNVHYRLHNSLRFGHLSLSWARWIQSIPPHPVSLRSSFTIIHPPTSLSFMWSLSFGYLINILHALFFFFFFSSSSSSPIRDKCPAHLILLDLIILIILGEEHQLRRYSLYSFVHPPVTSSFFGSNILLSILLSHTLIPCSSLNVRYQVSHQYRTTSKMIISHNFNV
jgi:hypothetical protein